MLDLLTLWVDADPEAEWQLWYADSFDREAPRQVQAEGRGLAAGLARLWRYHLRDGVDADGQITFSRYNLWWKDVRRSITIPRHDDGAARLRAWVFGRLWVGRLGPLAIGNGWLLRYIASVHSRLLADGDRMAGEQAGLAILDAASAAEDLRDFRRRLEALLAP